MIPLNKVSKKCRYGLQAIFELAWRKTTEPVKVRDIALAQSIPDRFLEVILVELKHGGFVESRRGSDGGYLLRVPAENLTVGQVIDFFQGNRPSGANIRLAEKVYSIGDYAFAKMWNRVSDAVSNIYEKTTFASLVEDELEKRIQYVPNYAI